MSSDEYLEGIMKRKPEIDPNDPKMQKYFRDVVDIPPPTCYCRCNETFRSHCYIDYNTGARHTQHKCPGCGSHSNVHRVSHDPEVFGIRR